MKENLIEFQLGGGGYGTLFDETADVHEAASEKTSREKSREKAIHDQTDYRTRKRMKEDLNDLRSERFRDDRLAKAVAAQTTEIKREHIRQKASQSGSRFNLRYTKSALQQSIPTPQMIIHSLSEWLEFLHFRAILVLHVYVICKKSVF